MFTVQATEKAHRGQRLAHFITLPVTEGKGLWHRHQLVLLRLFVHHHHESIVDSHAICWQLKETCIGDDISIKISNIKLTSTAFVI
jgi:hypothetical protein